MSDSPGGVDKKVFEYLKHINNGFYIEAGANNGVWQSNTLMLQNIGWKGLLVEPNEKIFKQLISNRPFNYYYNCALVDDSYKKEFIDGFFFKDDYENSLCGQIAFEENDHCCSDRWGKEKAQPVKARTLDAILKEYKIKKQIDFLSLDVEGYEINALNGLNLKINKPKYILVESSSNETRRKEILQYMQEFKYLFIEQLSINDQLYKLVE